MIASAYIPQEEGQILMSLLKRYPGVTIIDLDAIIGQARRILDRAGLAVQFVFAFSLLAAVVVVLAAVRSNRGERVRGNGRAANPRRSPRGHPAEPRRGVRRAGRRGRAAGGGRRPACSGCCWPTVSFELDYSLDPLLLASGVAAGAVLIGLAGMLAVRGALNAPLMSVLRGD